MRVFAALPVPPETSIILEKLTFDLKKYSPGLKVVGPQGFHITLVFFGELQEARIERVMGLIESPALNIARIKASLDGLGQFPKKGNPRVIYCALREGALKIIKFYQTFYKLLKELDKNLARYEKDFIPHITLARNKRERLDLEGFTIPSDYNKSFSINRFVLYQSILKVAGAEYRPLKSVIFT